MRHGASLVAAMEGISRPAFRVASELSKNSRAGLTIRFLSKKLELPPEEIEYIIDVHPRLFFIDLTKAKLVAEGHSAVKRITDGLENHGDVPSLFRRIKALNPHEFRRFEERIGVDRPGPKKAAAEETVARHYRHPDSVVEYVATRGFSPVARELFDIVWQSKVGVMPVHKIRSAHDGSEYEVEQGLWELFQGFALFEMFRFDAEDRLLRVAGLLSEVRQWRETSSAEKARKITLKAHRGKTDHVESRALDFSERICRLVAAIAAKPARLRGNGDLFREDRQRLSNICAEEAEPSLNTCLWVAQGVGWLARVDNELRAGELEPLIELDRVRRHGVLFDWFVSSGNEAASRSILTELLDEMKPGAWYPTLDFVRYAMQASAEHERPVLKSAGGHWQYISPSATSSAQRGLARSLEEAFLWLGVVDRAEHDGDTLFTVTELGRALLTGTRSKELGAPYPDRDTEIVVQPNFDIVVPSLDMDPLLTVPLEQFAVRASTGQATVYHVSKESFTQAVQEGHDAEAFVEFLLSHNRGGSLPANVMTTLDDWRGGMKRVRLRTLHVLESDDPLILADLLHRRRFKKHLHVPDPHKVATYSKITKADLTKALEKDGFIVE